MSCKQAVVTAGTKPPHATWFAGAEFKPSEDSGKLVAELQGHLVPTQGPHEAAVPAAVRTPVSPLDTKSVFAPKRTHSQASVNQARLPLEVPAHARQETTASPAAEMVAPVVMLSYPNVAGGMALLRPTTSVAVARTPADTFTSTPMPCKVAHSAQPNSAAHSDITPHQVISAKTSKVLQDPASAASPEERRTSAALPTRVRRQRSNTMPTTRQGQPLHAKPLLPPKPDFWMHPTSTDAPRKAKKVPPPVPPKPPKQSTLSPPTKPLLLFCECDRGKFTSPLAKHKEGPKLSPPDRRKELTPRITIIPTKTTARCVYARAWVCVCVFM